MNSLSAFCLLFVIPCAKQLLSHHHHHSLLRYALENWDLAGTPKANENEPDQTSGRWCMYAAWLTIIAASSHLGMIQGGKVRTEGSAERAGISNGKIRCMTIRYIIVRYF